MLQSESERERVREREEKREKRESVELFIFPRTNDIEVRKKNCCSTRFTHTSLSNRERYTLRRKSLESECVLLSEFYVLPRESLCIFDFTKMNIFSFFVSSTGID